MPVAELVRRLEADSAKVIEPFNSLGYREAVSRGSALGPELAAAVKAANRSSFLTLMAPRKVSKEAYGTVDDKLKVAILVDALRTSKYFNTWGLPHLYWEDAAKAVIELGDSAVEPLKGLLQDTREAPVWGSEEVMEYQQYKYRVNDYAWALLREITGRKTEIPTDPATRNKMMTDLGNEPLK